MIRNIRNFVKTKREISRKDNMNGRKRESDIQRMWLSKCRRRMARNRRFMMPDPRIQIDPATALCQLFTARQRTLVNKVVYYSQRYHVTYVSQDRLARETGYSRRHIINLLDYCESLGIVGRINRGVKRTCLYYVSPFFDQPWVQHALRNVLRCWLTLALGMLFSVTRSQGDSSPHFTQGYRHGYYLKTQRDSQYQHASSEPLSMGVSGLGTPESLLRQEAAAGDAGHGGKKKREVMEATVSKLQPAVQHVLRQGYTDLSRGMPLTPKGAIKLDVFPVTVHRQVYREYTRKWRELRQPFAWYYKRCLEVCDAQEVTPQWRYMYEILSALGYTNDHEQTVDLHTLQRLQRQQMSQSDEDRSQTQESYSAEPAPAKSHQRRYMSTQEQRRQQAVERSNRLKHEARHRRPQRYTPQERQQRLPQALADIDTLRRSNPALAQVMMDALPEELYNQMQAYLQQRTDDGTQVHTSGAADSPQASSGDA